VLTTHVDRLVARYCDNDLRPEERRKVEAHLAGCARCQRAVEDFRFAASMMAQIEPVAAPPLWPAIAAAQRSLDGAPPPRWRAAVLLRFAAGMGAVAAVVAAAMVWRGGVPPERDGGPWQIERVRAGTLVTEHMDEGQSIQTADAARVTIRVGSFGTVDVERGSDVRLGPVRGQEYRIVLDRGTISARITAPPRLFFVDTPSSTVVDLGCAYTLTVDEGGIGLIRVTEGWTALEWRGRESVVPAGAIASTHPALGPGIPTFEDASPRLRSALDLVESGDRNAATLETVLREARPRDTLSLWHLLARVDGRARVAVFERIAALSQLPASVDRTQVLALDSAALLHLRQELAWGW
jgi:anti-sigma factor RsiW